MNKALIKHNSKAERRMITNVPVVQIGTDIQMVEEILDKKTVDFVSIDYIYIVDENRVLLGVISIKEVFKVINKSVRVEEVMKKSLSVVYPGTHQERVVYLALAKGLKAIPVVNKEKQLLGVITFDEILQIFNQEVREDAFRFGGILFQRSSREHLDIKASAREMIKSRLPWLIIGAIGGTLAASVVSGFEEVLSKFLMLASFIPVLVYLSDAVGTQSETLIIRNLALNPNLSYKTYLWREFKISLVLALVSGVIVFLIALIGWRNPVLSFVIGLSMFFGIIGAVLISTFLPLVFKRFNLDPAVATGPFATLISDIATLGIYFTVATLILRFYGLL